MADIIVTPLIAPPINVTLSAPISVTVAFSSAQGPSGPGGTSSLIAFQQIATSDGAQALTLPQAAITGWYLLCINGLRQPASSYSVSGTALTLPAGLNVLTGDLISFDYTT